ncbi:MAG: DUF928 domain-containing protein [Leptolyngbyaceae cyanobacterium RU_5_1]|nr:DUF928 domain-containing protein [Leptolyngbyaceae cyanobacterium RU_5_1]
MIYSLLRVKSITACLALIVGFSVGGVPLLTTAQQYVPPKRGIPKRREGAGTRGPSDICVQGQKLLMPLIPVEDFGYIASKTPVFFWYIPTTNAKTAEFKLLDNADEELHSSTITLNRTSGLVSYKLPELATNKMEFGKNYIWQFSLICDPNQPSRNPFVEGGVQRVEPDATLKSALKKAKTSRDRASVYASAGIWHEAIAILAKQRCDRLDDPALKASWETLLKSGQLENYVQEPLIQICGAIGSKIESK